MKTKSLKINALLNVIKTIMSLLYPLITFPYASRILLPDGIGKVNFTNSIAAYFSLIASLGIGTYGIREASKIRDNKTLLSQFSKELLTINLISTIIAYSLFLVTLLITPKLHDYTLLLFVSSISIPFSALGIEWLYGAIEEYGYITLRSIIFQILTLFFLFFFVKTKEDYILYCAMGVFSRVGSNICNLIHARKYIDLRTGLPLQLKKHIKPVFIFFGTNIAISVFTILDTSMLGFLRDDIQVGYYVAASKLTRMIRDLFPAVFTVLFARLSITGNKDMVYFKRLTEKTLRFILCFSLPVIAGLGILTKPIILLLSGTNYLEAVPVMYILLPLILFSSWGGFLGGSVLSSLGKEKTYLYCVLAGAGLNAIMNYFFINLWGAWGAGLSTILTEVFFAVIYSVLVRDLIDFKKVLSGIIKYSFATVLMAFICLNVNKLFTSNISKLFFVTLSGIATYLIILLVMKDEILMSALRFIQSRFTKTEKKETISFLLPDFSDHPIGGYKVVFEYANSLSEKGYKVLITYPMHSAPEKGKFKKLRQARIFLRFKILKKYKLKWFQLSPKVKETFIRNYSDKSLSESQINSINKSNNKFFKYVDYIVATSVDTAYYASSIKTISEKKKFYLVQDYEKWLDRTDEYVESSFRLPLNKIAISPWLVEKINNSGSSAILIPNGFDFNYFTLTTPVENRDSNEVCLMYHLDERKRLEDALEALSLVKESKPDLHVNMFGVPDKPENLPDWFSYTKQPTKKEHNEILNKSSIFISSSKAEGMALPPGEALISGCALCLTDIPGFALYAKENETALLSPVFNPKKLAENIIYLMENPEKRINLAKNGNQLIKSFTWNKAADSFTAYINKCKNPDISKFKTAVVACTYNGAKYIEHQIQSILNQNHPIDQIFISDDKSTDNTFEILTELQKKYPEIIQINRNEKNLGYRKNFEQTLLLAKDFDIIFLCDQDDEWLPEKVESILYEFASNPNTNLVFSNGHLTDSELNIQNDSTLFSYFFNKSRKKVFKNSQIQLLMNGGVITGATMAIKNTLIEKVVPFSEIWIHDEWIAIHAACNGNISFIDKPLIKYRIHQNQQVGLGSHRHNFFSWLQYLIKDASAEDEINKIQVQLQKNSELKKFLPENERTSLENLEKFYTEKITSYHKNFFGRLTFVVKNNLNGNYRKYGQNNANTVKDIVLHYSR
ncbi:MAG: glycosyltransferase [Treponema sp.]|nr:glycosyltransferase [Treponema sp.]